MLLATSSGTESAARLYRHIDIVRMSAMRQLKVRYRGTFLGVLWSFGNPLLMTTLYTTLFGTAFASYYQGSAHRYIVSVLIGVIVATFFTQSTTEALVSVVSNGGLLNKVSVDPETFPVASVVANAFQQSITTFPVLAILAGIITHDPIRVVLTGVLLAALVGMVAGFSLILSAAFVYARDLANLWGVFSFIMWMTAAVFYPVALAPASIRPWFNVNPIGLMIAALRDVVLNRGSIDLTAIAECVGLSLLLVIVGHVVFRSLRSGFMDLI